MKTTVSIQIMSDPRYLSLLREVTGRFCMISGIDDQTTGRIKLAVDEACSNVIKYAYHGDRSKRIGVKYECSKKQFSVVIEDSGEKADPENIKGRDLEDVRPGGLGLHFIKRVFDRVEFDAGKVKGNRLILIKKAGGKDAL